MLAAVQEYLTAMEKGQKPNRQEFLVRYSDIAGELADCLDGLEFVHAACPDFCQAGTSEPTDILLGATEFRSTVPLGDYRIIRLIGRGGMGLVYEAEQLSLGRRVALKILPFAAALDPKQLQRFKNEVHAAAQLHHTHIVPIFGVGCERGVHYYAMQFIEGQTLASLIKELRQAQNGKNGLPTKAFLSHCAPADYKAIIHDCRPVKAEGTTTVQDRGLASQALHTKPASSILGSKSSFFRAVAKIGIQAADALEHAHQLGVVHRDIKPANLLVDVQGNLWITDFGLAHCQSQAGLTMTGDLVGTLRYMSPEQALAKRVPVDHRTDIYSLGATLYELLTLEPVFPGKDRQELLRQIAFEEPKPPRQNNRAIPTEVETIVLKALEKTPGDRYANAQELADDLERFLENKPIRARRPNLMQRVRKWGRRHVGVTVTAGVALALLLTVTSLGLFWNNLMIRREQGRTQAANERLRDNLGLSLKTLDEIYLKVLEVRLPRDREAVGENQELLTKALGFYEQFAERNEGDPKVQREVASAYDRAGVLHMRLGHYDQAAAALDRAEEVAAHFMGEFAEEPEPKEFLAEVHLHKGELAYAAPLRMKEPRQGLVAQGEYRQGIKILEPVIEKGYLGLKGWQTLASLHSSLASLGQHGGDLVEREKNCRKAIAVRKTVVDMVDEPRSKLFAMQQLAAAHADLGNLLGDVEGLGRLDKGENELRQAIALLIHIEIQAATLSGYQHGRLPGFPNGQPVQDDLARVYWQLGSVLRLKGRYQAAESAFSRAVAYSTQVVKDWPGEPAFRRRLAATRRDYGILLFEQGKRTEALAQYRQSVDILVELEKQFPDLPENQDDLCDSLDPLAELYFTQGDREKAADLFRQIVGMRERLAAGRPDDATHCGCLAWFYAATCIDPRFRNPARAVVLAEKALAQFPQNAWWCGVLGVAQYRNGQWQEAVASLEKANRLRPYCYEGFLFFLAMAHWRLGEKEAARACYDRAVGLMKARDYPAHLMARAYVEARGLLGIPEQPPAKVANP
jgi:serine/threonine protein kinase